MSAPAPDSSPAPALQRCVGNVAAFLSEAWGRRHLHHRSPGGFGDLLTFDDVDHLLSSSSLRTPTFRLVKDGATIPVERYTRSGRVGGAAMAGIADPIRIHALFREGATIVLQGMHRFWRPLSEFCRELELALGHPTQVNAYITPPGSRGLAVHEDSHDVFVLQAFGRKHWEVWSRREPFDAEAPGPDEGAEAVPPGRNGHGEAALSVELEPGDALYIPDTTPHAARTQETVSGHLTVGVLTRTWADVVRQVTKRAERDPALRDRLPAAYHRRPDEFAAQLNERLTHLERWLEKLDPTELAFEDVRRFLTTRRPLLEGTLEAGLHADDVGDDDEVRHRPRSVCEVAERGAEVLVLLGDRELRMPASAGPAMRFAAGHASFRVRDLSPYLDEESRLVLVRRLIREGLLEAVPAG